MACAAPALVLLAVVVPFLRFHEYDLLLPESLILIGGAALIGVAIGALSRIRPQTLGPMLTALTICVYIFYRQEVTDLLVNAADAIADIVGNPAMVLAFLGAALFLLTCLACILARRHLDVLVVAVFGTIVLTTLVLPTDTGGEPVDAGVLPENLKPLPPVIHIILDEHISLAALPDVEGIAEARRMVPPIYKDFATYERAYSRFAETKFSLTSLMNGDLGADVAALVDGDLYSFAPTKNAWFEVLREKGYAIKVYQSAWYDMCGGLHPADACYTSSFFSPNPIQRTPLSTTQRLRALAAKLFVGRGALQLEPMVGMEALARFRADIAEAPRGVAYIVHLLIPHFGYLYADDCALLDPSQWERESFGEDHAYSSAERAALYRRYIAQLICANRKMDALFAELKALGVYDEATIIVHGDHGSRIGERPYLTEMPETLTAQDMMDHYATFLAIKAPGVAPGSRDAPAALQQVFAETFLNDRGRSEPDPGEVFIRTDEDNNFGVLDFSWPGWPPAGQPPVTGALAPSFERWLSDLRR